LFVTEVAQQGLSVFYTEEGGADAGGGVFTVSVRERCLFGRGVEVGVKKVLR